MNISTVHDNGNYYTVTLASGTVVYVPKDPMNSDNLKVQEWVAAGGVIT